MDGLPDVKHAPIYCRPCKRRGPLFEWYIDWEIPKRGNLRARLQGKCRKGHWVSRFIPLGVRSPMQIHAGPLQWDDIPWENVSQISYIGRLACDRFIDIRNAAIIDLYRNGASVAGLAALFDLEPGYITNIVGRTNRDIQPTYKNRTPYKKRKSTASAVD